MKVNGQWIPCVCNSSYSFIPILLKLYICLYQALKICMWFGYDTQINFITFVRNLILVIFSHFDNESEWTGGTLCAQLLLQLHSDSFETLQFNGLYNALKIRIWFAYNPQLNFYHFFAI